MSSYTGICVQRLNDGTIHTVQVEDTAGLRLPLDAETYTSRNCSPPIDSLPDCVSEQES